MDAAPTIRPCEVDVTLGGQVYTVPALPAADWLVAVIGEPGAVLPGLLPDGDRADISRRILRGQLEPEEINRAWRDLIAVVTGRSWWSAARLCMSASDPEAWPSVHGRLLTSGVDLDVVSIGAMCNAIYFMIMSSSVDDEERSKHQFELELPPPGYEDEAFEDRERVAEDFMAVMQQLKQFG